MYVPMRYVDAKAMVQPMRGAMFVVRTASADPMTMASMLRQEIQRTQPEFRVSNVTTQAELVREQTLRERLLALLAGFFAMVALLLASIGLYGVLHYSVLQREREIGIRVALGAAAANIARLVTVRVFAMVLLGAFTGLMLGTASMRYVQTLLFGVKASDPSILLVPMAVLLGAALLAAVPAVMRAVRIDPAEMLRAE